MKKILAVFLVLLLGLGLVSCSSKYSEFDGEYEIKMYRVYTRGDNYAYNWQMMSPDLLSVTIEKGRIVHYHGISEYTGKIDSNDYVNWDTGVGPASEIFDGCKCFGTRIGFNIWGDNQVSLWFYLSAFQTDTDWTHGTEFVFVKVED